MGSLRRSLSKVLSFKSSEHESGSSSSPLPESFSKLSKKFKNISEKTYANIDQSLQNWSIPPVKPSKVYANGDFSPKQNYIIKLVEDTIFVTEDGQEIVILSPKKIEFHASTHKYLHLGLIQVAVKPLVALGTNADVMVSVRDKRHLDFRDSLLGIIEGSLSDGPLYFECCPNLTIDLHNEYELVSRALVLGISTKGFSLSKTISNVAVVYKLFYKVMHTIIPDIAYKELQKQIESTIFLTNVKNTIIDRKQLAIKPIPLPHQWTITDTNKEEQQKIHVSQQISQIIEHDDGKVDILFAPRASTSTISSSNTSVNLKSDHCETCGGTAYPANSIPPTTDNTDNVSFNDFADYHINVVTIEETQSDSAFVMDYESLKQQFLTHPLKPSFCKLVPFKHQALFREKYFAYIKAQQQNISFFDWLAIQSPITSVQVNAIWESLNGKKFDQVHPPLAPITIQKDIKDSPFKSTFGTDGPISKRDLVHIIEQNNYTNMYLSTIKTSTVTTTPDPPPVKKISKPTKPFFPPSASPSMPSYKTPLSAEFFDILTSKLSQLKITPTTAPFSSQTSPPAPPKGLQKDKGPAIMTLAPASPPPDSQDESAPVSPMPCSQPFFSSTENDDDDVLPEIHRIIRSRSRKQSKPFKQFQTRYPLTKQYYSRPTPSYLILEETVKRNKKYDGNAIYDWSIDGLSEYQVIEVVLKMHIYAKASILQNHTEPDTAKAIVCGFTGQLYGWWHYVMDEDEREAITNHLKTDALNNPIINQNGDWVYDSVNHLMAAIIWQFVGHISSINEKISDQLQNLRCRTLNDYRWYKDTFFSKLYSLTEKHDESFWKERFIAGLPPYFAAKIKDFIKEHYNNTLADLSYGDITQSVQTCALSICNDLIQKEKSTLKHDLGNFCFDFGQDIDVLKYLTPKHRIKRQNKSSHFFKPPYYKHPPRFNSRRRPSYAFKPSSKIDPHTTHNVCYKCGKPGHYANKCRSIPSTKKIHQVAFSSSSSSEDECHCVSNLQHTSASSSEPEINVLTAHEELLLSIGDQLTDPNLKLKYFTEVIAKLSGPPQPTEEPLPPYLMKKQKHFKEQLSINNSHLNFASLMEIVNKKPKHVTIQSLQTEVNQLKHEIQQLTSRITNLEQSNVEAHNSFDSNNIFVESISKSRSAFQRWHTPITFTVKGFSVKCNALIDSGADLNCLREGFLPLYYCTLSKEFHSISVANGQNTRIKYEVPLAHICHQGICIPLTFIIIPGLKQDLLLGTPFLKKIQPFSVSENGISTTFNGKSLHFAFISPPEDSYLNLIIHQIEYKNTHIQFLKHEILLLKTEQTLQSPMFKSKLNAFQTALQHQCCSDVPSAFWARKHHIVKLPYIPEFTEAKIPTKANPSQMPSRLREICQKEITDLLRKKLTTPSQSPWSCTAFYVENAPELERGVPRLVINYKPLNKVLKTIRYPLPNKSDLLKATTSAIVFSKFDLKSGFWQIQVHPSDRYKTAFNTPFGQYQWNVMPFGLKNAPSEFQKIMNDIYNPYFSFILVYIDDLLVFSPSIDQHWKHLQNFQSFIRKNGLVLSQKKMNLFQTEITFLGFKISNQTLTPVNRVIAFASKFPDQLIDRHQLQRFLGCLNYLSDFYKNVAQDRQCLQELLSSKNPFHWTPSHTAAVQQIKQKVQSLPCLHLAISQYFKIVQTDASDIGYGGILLQQHPSGKEQLVCFTSKTWKDAQVKYSTFQKEVLAIVLCVQKFQADLLNQNFLIRVDCQSAKSIFSKDVKNLAAKQVFARWQAILSILILILHIYQGNQILFLTFCLLNFLQLPL
ncbi:hypothetical protein Syun_013655 [Stephania yunnanensis]|uniref:Reverse transcriptase n=1 Tax=Stephania yunnanensis TaxID=152371 RepID=A0AAP0JJW1_9MAGN